MKNKNICLSHWFINFSVKKFNLFFAYRTLKCRLHLKSKLLTLSLSLLIALQCCQINTDVPTHINLVNSSSACQHCLLHSKLFLQIRKNSMIVHKYVSFIFQKGVISTIYFFTNKYFLLLKDSFASCYFCKKVLYIQI